MKNSKANKKICEAKEETSELSRQYSNLYWKYHMLVMTSNTWCNAMNNIADVVRGYKKLFASHTNMDGSFVCEQITIDRIPEYYGRDFFVAFYISESPLNEFTEEQWQAQDDDGIYWLGDFDRGAGGAGDLLFSLAGRQINQVVTQKEYNDIPRPAKS